MTRFVCLDCAADMNSSVDTIDLCWDCVEQKVQFKRPFDDTLHLSSHALLQIRSSVPNRRVYDLIRRAYGNLLAERGHEDCELLGDKRSMFC